MRFTEAERQEIQLIRKMNGKGYVLEALKTPLSVGNEIHTVALYQQNEDGGHCRAILTGMDYAQLISRIHTILADKVARKGEIYPYLLNHETGRDDFYVKYWPELHPKGKPRVWVSLYQGEKPVSVMVDIKTLSTLTNALRRVLA